MIKPRIAVIGVKGLPGYGGSSKTNDQVLKKLSHKYEFTVFALDTYASQKDYYGIKQEIYKSHKNKKLSSLFLYLKSFIVVLFSKKYDLVHLNHGFSGIMVPLLKIKYPTLLTLHGLIYSEDDKWSFIEKTTFRFFQFFAFRSPHLLSTVQKSSVIEIQKYRKKEVIYIPNGVEDNFSTYEDVRNEDVICFAAARIYHLKGCHDFLEALIQIGYEGKVQIIGDLNQVPSYREKIISLAKSLNVEFYGLITDSTKLFTLIKSSKLFVFPSYSEGMSNMLLEVASLKVPLIASDIIPNKDVFSEDEVTFFETGNSDDLAIKIMTVLNDYEKAETKAKNAYERVISEYNWDNICNLYDSCYQQLLKSVD
jgi:glycosyltransferase involved in cell wall biosynthesis